jgi:hypothetical protein
MACLPRNDMQAQWSSLYDVLTDPVFLNKGVSGELTRTLHKEEGCFIVFSK